MSGFGSEASMHCPDTAPFCSPFVYCRLRPVLRSIIQQAVGVNLATFGLRIHRLVEGLIGQMDIKGVCSIPRKLKDEIGALSGASSVTEQVANDQIQERKTKPFDGIYSWMTLADSAGVAIRVCTRDAM